MKLYSLILATLMVFFSLNTVFADFAPTFHNDTLTLPSVDSLEQPGVYQDLVFKYTEQGEWQLFGGKVGAEIQEIEKVEIIKTETFPVQVFLKITGIFTSGCQEIGQVKYWLIDNKLEVSAYYNNNDKFSTGEFTCTAGFVPFTKTILLPVYALKKGEYEYSVNGNFTGVFSLDEDNEL